jgi:hypothetical protein
LKCASTAGSFTICKKVAALPDAAVPPPDDGSDNDNIDDDDDEFLNPKRLAVATSG